jgi:hypothetical protein
MADRSGGGDDGCSRGGFPMRFPRAKSPLRFLFGHSRREDYLVRYVLREHRRGRPLAEVLEDPYVHAWSTPAERGRLLERPELVAALGESSVAELRAVLAAGSGS